MKANTDTEFTDISDVEKHRKGMSRLYFLRKLRSFSVCTKMMRAGTLHPVVERTWQCCSMTDTGHTGHTGQAAELLFKQTGSVLLPQTQRQKTFTPHAATFYNPIYLPQRSACDLLPPTTQSKSHRGDSNRYSPLQTKRSYYDDDDFSYCQCVLFYFHFAACVWCKSQRRSFLSFPIRP